MKIPYADIDGNVAGFHELHEGQHVRLDTSPWRTAQGGSYYYGFKCKKYPKDLMYRGLSEEVLESGLPRQKRLRPPPGHQLFQSYNDGKLVKQTYPCPMMVGTLVRSDKLTKRPGWKRPGYGSNFSDPHVQEHEAWMAEHPELVLELVTGEIFWLTGEPMYCYSIDVESGEKRLVLNPQCRPALIENGVAVLEEATTVDEVRSLGALAKVVGSSNVQASYSRVVRREGGSDVHSTDWQYEEVA